jgi:hypothetical protein
LPVQRFDTIFVKSSAAFHRAEEFEGFGINIFAYSKTTTPETKKGLLQIKSGCEWAITAWGPEIIKNKCFFTFFFKRMGKEESRSFYLERPKNVMSPKNPLSVQVST